MASKNMNRLVIESVDFETLTSAHNLVPEFEPVPAAYFSQRCENTSHLKIIAKIGSSAAGYMVSYDRYQDGSLYCWMAGVVPEFRCKGIYSAMAVKRLQWAKSNSYKTLRIKTRNNRREMLSWLIKNGFQFTEVDKREPLSDSRIHLLKEL